MLQALFNAVDFGELTSFFSSQYLVLFLPAVILMYAVLPKRAKKYGLLLASFGFYLVISRRFIIYLMLNILW